MFYVHAGCRDNGRLSDLWAFHTRTREWQRLPDAPPPARGGPSTACTVDGRVWRLNGFDGSELGGSLDVYDPDTNRWTSVEYAADGVSSPPPRSVSALLPITVGGREYLVTLFGEACPSPLGHQGAGQFLSDVWAFDVCGEKWSEVMIMGIHPARQQEGDIRGDEGTPAPEARGWFGADVLCDCQGNAIVIQGGLNEANERLSDLWVLRFE